MKARVAWYAVMQCAISDDIRAVSGIVGLIDRYAFWLSVVIGIGGWAYICGGRIPAAFHAGYRKELRRFRWLCTAATGARIVSVISDALLTVLRLPGAELSAESLLPIFSIAIEVACAAALVFPNSQHRAGSDVHSGPVENLNSARRRKRNKEWDR